MEKKLERAETINFNKLKKILKNNTKCNIFISEEKYDNMVKDYNEITGHYGWAFGNAVQKGYIQIYIDKYAESYFYIDVFKEIIGKFKKNIHDNDICIVENYDKFNGSNIILSDKCNILYEFKKIIDSSIKRILDNGLNSEVLFYLFSGFQKFILIYEEILEIKILNKVIKNNVIKNNINKNIFHSKYSEEIIKLSNDFLSVTIFDYSKLKEILTNFSKLIYKYEIITNFSISKQKI
jgi:hypothetical protein